MIGIVNYGSGNINAFLNVYKKLAFEVITVSTINDINKCSRLILPGVGSFDWVMKKLIQTGLVPYLNEFVIKKKKPILGVCVGMQIMGKRSEEGNEKGFGWLNGHIKKFNLSEQDIMVLPHMGWNTINVTNDNKLLKGLSDAEFYFLHSYHFCTEDKNIISTETIYGKNFVSSLHFNNIYATQFHPEKSHEFGEKLLLNFASIKND